MRRDDQFIGMVEEDVPLEVLYETSERLVRMLRLALEEKREAFPPVACARPRAQESGCWLDRRPPLYTRPQRGHP